MGSVDPAAVREECWQRTRSQSLALVHALVVCAQPCTRPAMLRCMRRILLVAPQKRTHTHRPPWPSASQRGAFAPPFIAAAASP